MKTIMILILSVHSFAWADCFPTLWKLPNKGKDCRYLSSLVILHLMEATIWIARLGGYLARNSDGPPGPTAIWRGWQRLQDFCAQNLWVIVSSTGRV